MHLNLDGVAEIWRFVGEDEELVNKFLVVESLQESEDVDTKPWKLARRYIVSFYIGFLNSDFVHFPTPTLESNLVLYSMYLQGSYSFAWLHACVLTLTTPHHIWPGCILLWESLTDTS